MALCLMMGAYTFCVGSFPVLLPEVGAALNLRAQELGVVAGAFAFARMLTNVPAGLLMTHHVRRALVAAPVLMLAGAVLVASGAGFGWVVLGQVTMSIGYTLGNLASVTTILRQRADRGLASALNAFELSAMIAVLGAVTVIGLLPEAVPWNLAFLIGCAPIVIALGALKVALSELPPTDESRPWFARMATGPVIDDPGDVMTARVAFAAGAAIAVTYATVASFLIPLRSSREFGLDRGGIAQLMMLVQTVDIMALWPVGALADARGFSGVLGGVLLTIAAAIGLVGFGALPHVVAGSVLFGLGMAGWMLPLGLLRSATPATQIAWRTALYRVCVDGGMFLGPFLSGLLADVSPRLLPGTMTISLVVLAALVLLTARARGTTS